MSLIRARKYIENILEEDNKILRSEIIDLKTSLKINKCIIEEFLKNSSNIDLNIPYINKLKEEFGIKF